MLRAVLLACMAVVATAAPVQINSNADTPLVRTKRSEEAILFGNHQNFARMKKGDPHPKPFNALTEPEDAAVNPPEDAEQNQPEPATNAEQLDGSNQVNEVAQKGKSSQLDEEEQIEKLLTSPDAEVDPLTASADKAEEERILEQLMEDKKHPGAAHSNVPSEGLPIAHPDKVLEEEDPTLEEDEEEASGEADSSNLEENDQYKDYNQQPYYYENNKRARDYEADRLLFPPSLLKSYREKRSLIKSRESRSLPDAATAEDMMAGGPQEGAISKKLTGRVKRGLPISPAELEEILERDYYGEERIPEEDYYGGDEIYPMNAENEIPEEPTVERRAYNQWAGYEEGPVLDVDPRSELEDAMYLPEEDTDAVAENEIDPEEQRRLQLLEYLYNTNQAPSYGMEEEAEEGPSYPGNFEESWHDLGPAREVMQYEPEPYYGREDEQEEDFEMAPSKRQYLSLVPGNKRSDFYPYQYGPDGRWGAMVPDPDMEKRNEMAEYERLYELAQALNGPDVSERGYDKRFDDEEPAYYQDYDRRRK